MPGVRNDNRQSVMLKGKMTHIHFAAATGFPALSYSHILESLKQLNPDIQSINMLNKVGHGDFKIGLSCRAAVDETIYNIEKNNNFPVVGIGHSIGAVLTLIAASKRPDLF